MVTAGVKEARQHFTDYLSKVEKGEEIIISKRNEPIAIIKPFKRKVRHPMESHKALRSSILIKGKLLSEIVIQSREAETY